MLSKRLKLASVNDLKNFLKKKRKNPLSEKKREEIQNLIKQKRKNNWDFAGQFIESKLYKLACVQLKREGKAQRYTLGKCIGKCDYYEYNPLDVILTMRKIVDTTKLKGIKL